MKEKVALAQVETVVDKNIDAFLKKVKDISEIGAFAKSRKETSGFPILKPANAEYYEYKFFEHSLEWYIRDHLVNAVFAELFEMYGIESTWPSNETVHVCFSNERIEDVYPFEFIVCQNGKNIGYRFTSLCMEDSQLKVLFRKYRLEYVKTIDWSDTDSLESNKVSYGVSEKYRTQVFNVTLKSFFKEYFSEEAFSVYISKARAAVEKANYEIGFQTIPQLSLRYLSSFKAGIVLSLAEADFQSMRYQKINENGFFNSFATDTIPVEDYRIIDANFKTKCLYRALIGDEDFAKCFITSEYLYQIFKSGSNIDHTSVVSGYLKSIEQLVYKIMIITLASGSSDELWIKAKKYKKDNPNFRYNPALLPKRKVPQVLFRTENEKHFDIALAPLIWFLHDNVNGWHISANGKEVVHSYLLNYSQECRNEHFHKDNIYDFNDAVRIRNNTLILLYLIIGGCKMSGSLEKDYKLLGIKDDSYDRLYKKLKEIPRSVKNFYLKFENSVEGKAVRLHSREHPSYDANGNVQSEICFVKVEDFHIEDFDEFLANISEEDKVILSRNNMPQKVWFEKYGAERGLVEW